MSRTSSRLLVVILGLRQEELWPARLICRKKRDDLPFADQNRSFVSDMPATIPAMVNPLLLVWAREQAGFTREEAAQRSKRAVDTLRAWEEGEAQPTLRQAEALAKLYELSCSICSLPSAR